MIQHGLAFDKASVRTIDRDGRLHIALSNIIKATVNPYRGAEIPNAEELGLDPDRIYYLLRDPAEIAKAIETFNNLPILSKHVPVTADAPMEDLVIGSTGTDAAFEEPYGQNSAVVWVGKSIKDIQDERAKEWSPAYHYVADMTPGTYKGLRYDGIMRNIVGNHVALVKEGRQGSDVVVGDSKLDEGAMFKLKSRKALVVQGAVMAALGPKLAMDHKLAIGPLLADVTRANFKAKIPALATAIHKAASTKLAQDAEVSVEEVRELLESVQDITDGAVTDDVIDAAQNDDTPAAVDADGDVLSKVMAFLKGKISDEDLAELSALCGSGAADELDTEDNGSKKGPKDADGPKGVDKPAMDAALAAHGRTIVNRMNALQQAREDVLPVIGKVSLALDSAAAVYKLALDHKQIDVTDVHPSAYRALLLAATKEAPVIAQDSVDLTDAEARFRKDNPNAVTLIRSV